MYQFRKSHNAESGITSPLLRYSMKRQYDLYVRGIFTRLIAERKRKYVYKILAVYWQDDPTICTRLRMHRCINPYASHGQTSYHCQFVVPSLYLQSATANRCSIDRAAPGPVLRASLFQQAIDVLNLDYVNVNRWYLKLVITDPTLVKSMNS